jgi:hypothetical protein
MLRRDAEQAAIDRFGSAAAVADSFARQRAGVRTRRRRPLAAIALAVAGVAAASAFAAVQALQKPVFGVLSAPTGSRSHSTSGAVVYTPPALTLVRIDPRTLRPLPGRRVVLARGYWPLVRSPDGETAAASRGASVTLVGLAPLRRLGEIRFSTDANTVIRILAWPRVDRLVAVTQRMSRPYWRRVVSRAVVVIDPETRRVVARRPLPRTAIAQYATAGGRVVAVLGDSRQLRRFVTFTVIASDGSFRQRRLFVGGSSRSGPRLPTILALEPSGARAYLVVAGRRVLDAGRHEPRAAPARLDRSARGRGAQRGELGRRPLARRRRPFEASARRRHSPRRRRLAHRHEVVAGAPPRDARPAVSRPQGPPARLRPRLRAAAPAARPRDDDRRFRSQRTPPLPALSRPPDHERLRRRRLHPHHPVSVRASWHARGEPAAFCLRPRDRTESRSRLASTAEPRTARRVDVPGARVGVRRGAA